MARGAALNDAAAGAAIYVRRLALGGDGPRVAIKDSIDVAGVPTGMASASFADAPPAASHADVVRTLLDAGCRIVGKTNLHELAYGITGINGYTGTPPNPRAPGRIPGGSSSGSAVAVALGEVDFAIGTDTGGSIRVPAACCGIVGLKPSFGRISRRGVIPPVSSLDCVGPFARDAATLARAMALADPSFRPVPSPARFTIGRLAVNAAGPVDAAVDAALARAGAAVEPVTLPSFSAAYQASLDVLSAENWAAFGHLTQAAGLGADVRSRLLAAREVTPARVAAAETLRRALRAEIDAALERVDALALPTLPEHPPTLQRAADARASLALTALVRQFNLSGHPALSLPVGPADDPPVGLQLVGRHGDDAALVALACALQERLGATAPSTASR